MPFTAALEYTQKPRTGITLGGIGTGGIELRHDGVFYNWHIFNNLPFGSGTAFPFSPQSMLFFCVRYREPNKPPRIKLLQIDNNGDAAGIPLMAYTFPWITGVQRISTRASFPFVTLTMTDHDMPFEVTLEAFSPFIPHNVKDSALPAVVLRVRLRSTVDYPIEVNLIGTMRTGAGYDMPHKTYRSGLFDIGQGVMIETGVDGIDPLHASAGTQVLALLTRDSRAYSGWESRHTFYETVLRQSQMPNGDDTPARHRIDPQTSASVAMERMNNSVAVAGTLAPREEVRHTFLYTWHFPNLYSQAQHDVPSQREGNYYAQFFDSAADVARYVHKYLESLERRTRRFHDAFYDSTLDSATLDMINAQLNTFVSSSWLTRDGKFAIQEGILHDGYWGPMATIDVALYGGISTLALFPQLDKAMLYAHRALQLPSGEVSHGIPRNFAYFEPEDRPHLPTRVDLPGQYAILTLRHALWTGDHDFLREMWPSVTRALDFALRERDRDEDGLPEAEGANTSYDNLAMYGASAFVGSVWLSALTHAIAGARLLNDAAAQQRYTDVLHKARRSFEDKLWNGRYYRLYQHETRDDGCLTDQLIGEWANRLTHLESIVDAARIKPIVRDIVSRAYEADLGLRNCTWPSDDYLHDVPSDCWWDQANTMWSGTALSFAALLLYVGLEREALQIIHALDGVYRRNGLYFDHQEWGGHYFRAMSAWSIVNGYLGLSIHDGVYRFAPLQNPMRLVFAHPSGIARFQYSEQETTFESLEGVLHCREVWVYGRRVASVFTLNEGESVTFR